ncbi:MAG: hypothetical protein JO044_02395 [Mycobacteriaceae bacterium]|nr:hypothetical protein [Mycobacteriaceae bacterium]MBV9641405.1 hypothetical protein [Mycobacteriaceae bacterium]
MTTPGADLPEEPQKERGAQGSRDAESGPSGSVTDRPSATYEGDETVPAYGQQDASGFDSTGTTPPQDTQPAVPPYEGRMTSASGGARTGAATGPASGSGYTSPAPGQTPGGATASPAEEQPAAQMPESDRDADAVGPSHTAGTGRGEQKR